MPRHSMKFHLIAIASICAIVLLLFALIDPNPKATGDGLATGDRYVRIYSASWGLNCNTEILRQRSLPITLKPDGTAPTPLQPAMPDNVLPRVSELCNGKLVCSTALSSTLLGVDPLPSCFKQLQVSYRCFEIDRLWKKTIGQGEALQIDCNESADKDRR